MNLGSTDGITVAPSKTTDELVDLILRISFESTMPEVKTLVGHRWPDDDTWLCLWMAKKFIQKAKNANVAFVNAGEIFPGSENDAAILHFDTGKGEYDQHEKKLGETCSAQLLTDGFLLTDDPGLKPLLAMVTAVDNIKSFPPTAMHFIIEGYPRHKACKKPDGSPDWQKVQERVFELFDIVYGQETQRVQGQKDLENYTEWTILPNGIKIASLLWHPELRQAAFDKRAAVVVWTIFRYKNGFYTGIQVNRDYPIYLDNVIAALRSQETKVRNGGDTTVWYLHDSRKLILNGSHTRKLLPEEYTKLAPRQIVGLVHRALSAIPREVVAGWKIK